MKTLKRTLALLLALTMVFALAVVVAVPASANSYVIQRQLETKWKSYYYGGGNLYNTGCGIFSLVNAVGYLTGNSMSITEVASWAHSINAFNVNGGDGTYRLVLYPKVQARYGATYGFTLNCGSQNQGWWAGASSTTLKNHLANGGVAVGHVPGHFIAIVGYDSGTNKFHVYDSAPSTARGTNSTGATGLGDCWVTQDRLSTGKLNLDWFCLLSATGASAEYLALEELIQHSLRIICTDYNSTQVASIRAAYTNAVAVYNDKNSTDSQYKAAYNSLYAAIYNDTTSVSVGKSYTASANTRTDDFADDGKRLTDGVKGSTNGGASYSGWLKSTEIVIDLGVATKMNTFTAYFAACAWGISSPAGNVRVDVAYSNSGTAFTTLGSSTDAILKYGSGIGSTEVDEWSTYETTIVTPDVSGRYVKFTFTHLSEGHIWLDEVEASYYADPLLNDRIYINYMNDKVKAGSCVLFTPAFGEITPENANHVWTQNLIAKWDPSIGEYVVKSNAKEEGTATTFTLESDEIMISAHSWEGVSDSVPGSDRNLRLLGEFKNGDIVKLDGITVSLGYYDILAYATRVPKVVEEPTPEPEPDPEPDPDPSYPAGDINADGLVDLFDYLIIKQVHFGMYVPNETEKLLGDFNNDGFIDMFDYISVKTICLASN